jgi:hypothetical protein
VIDAASVWKSEFKNLPLVSSSVGDAMSNIADFVDQRVTGKMILGAPMGGSFSFTFNKAAFLSPLTSLTPSPSNSAGMNALASAWQSAVLSSNMIVASGAYVGAPTPATMFATAVAVVDSSSVAAAYSTLLSQLLAAQPVSEDPPFPTFFYDAFVALKYNVSGINMIPPPAGPQPLVAAMVPVQ